MTPMTAQRIPASSSGGVGRLPPGGSLHRGSEKSTERPRPTLSTSAPPVRIVSVMLDMSAATCKGRCRGRRDARRTTRTGVHAGRNVAMRNLNDWACSMEAVKPARELELRVIPCSARFSSSVRDKYKKDAHHNALVGSFTSIHIDSSSPAAADEP